MSLDIYARLAQRLHQAPLFAPETKEKRAVGKVLRSPHLRKALESE